MLQRGTVLDSGGSQASFLMQSYTLTKRSFVNMSRDFGYYWLRLLIYVVVTVCIGTIYLNIGTSYNSILVLFLYITLENIGFTCGRTVFKIVKSCETGKRCMCFFCVRFCHIHVNRWVPFLCGGHEGKSWPASKLTSHGGEKHFDSLTFAGFPKGEIKWPLWCNCICYREYTVSYAIPHNDNLHLWNYLLLYGSSSPRL